MIYLDNAATTQIDPEVIDAMMPYLTYEYGNPGGLYGPGFSAKNAVENAREQVAKFMNAESPDQIIFTSGGTESNNTVLRGFCLKEMEGDGKRRGFAVSTIEHDSVLRPAEYLKTKLGFDVSYVKANKMGIVTTDSVESCIKNASDMGLVSIMYMNNEIGSINDIKLLADFCHENGMLFHSDCVQAAGCIKLDVSDLGCDFASVSSHKIHGPKGVGALYIKDKSNTVPLVFGGSEQEFGIRGGTENVAGIVGFGKACEIYSKTSPGSKETALKREFWNVLCQEMRAKQPKINFRDNALSSIRHGKTLSITFDDIDAEALVLSAWTKGLCISAGSACTSHEQKPSHVLTAIGLSDDAARNTVRVSFSRMNRVGDVQKAARILSECIDGLVNIVV